MKHRIYFLLLFVGVALNSYSQADCVIKFEYIGTIVSDSLNVEEVGLATTLFIVGYVEKKSDLSFYFSKVNDGKLLQVMVSHMSSYFCKEPSEIIRDVFKQNRANYPIIICQKGNKGKFEKNIPIDKIEFSYDKIEHKIVINLGEIKI